MITWFLAQLGPTLDERISTLISLILCATLPILFAGAMGSMPVPQ